MAAVVNAILPYVSIPVRKIYFNGAHSRQVNAMTSLFKMAAQSRWFIVIIIIWHNYWLCATVG